MSHIRLADYLGVDVINLLKAAPFSGWKVTRSTDEDLPAKEIWYEFEGHGVEVICDAADRIRTVFLHRGDGEALCEVPFSSSRQKVLARFGAPSKSGGPVRASASVLGASGGWDRFILPRAAIHFQYRVDCDEVEMITLMRLDAVPPQ